MEATKKGTLQAQMQMEMRRIRLEETVAAPWFSSSPENPFEATARLQGRWGTVRMKDAPAAAGLRAPDFGDGPEATLKSGAFSLRASFVSVADSDEEWPPADGNLRLWVELLERMPTSVHLRLQQAIDAIGYEPSGGGDSEGN